MNTIQTKARQLRTAYPYVSAPLRTGGFKFSPTEMKYSDFTDTHERFNDTGMIGALSPLQRGTDVNQRIGRKVVWKSVQVSMDFLLAPLATNPFQVAVCPPTKVRAIVYVDMQANGQQGTAAELLETVDVDSPLNMANRDRFRILVDNRMTLDAFDVTNHISGKTICHWEFYKKINITTIYNSGNAGTAADINTGAIKTCLITNANGPALTDNEWCVVSRGVWRLRFVDP